MAGKILNTTMGEYYSVVRNDRYLKHHGIKGQKWGIRRFQNLDGSWTAAGKARRRQESGQLKDYVNKDGSLTTAGKERYKQYLTLKNDEKYQARVQTVVDQWDKKVSTINEKYKKKDGEAYNRIVEEPLKKKTHYLSRPGFKRAYDVAYSKYLQERNRLEDARKTELKEQKATGADLHNLIRDMYASELGLSDSPDVGRKIVEEFENLEFKDRDVDR